MENTYHALAERAGLCENAIRAILPAMEKIDGAPELEALWQKTLDNDHPEYLIGAFSERTGIERNLLELAACVLLTRNMKQHYDALGYPEDVFLDSMKDIPLWADRCMRRCGTWGMFGLFWHQNFLAGRDVRLVRLEFGMDTFKGEYWEKDGVCLRKGDPIIDTHIPEDEPITPELVDASFDKAVRFFGTNVFFCSSWLLWPLHQQILPETSNIRRFAARFNLLDCYTNDQNSNLWRIFGYRDNFDLDSLPQETSLQRIYVSILRANGNRTGGGSGFYVHQPR